MDTQNTHGEYLRCTGSRGETFLNATKIDTSIQIFFPAATESPHARKSGIVFKTIHSGNEEIRLRKFKKEKAKT